MPDLREKTRRRRNSYRLKRQENCISAEKIFPEGQAVGLEPPDRTGNSGIATPMARL
jgi:hypothetical protein